MRVDKNFQLKNREVYERLYGRSLTNQELFNIRQNLVGFFTTLIKIDQHSKKKVYATTK
jgi:hypothetical protein